MRTAGQRLGNVYRKMNKLPEAAEALREAIRQMPEQPDPHLTLAAVLAQQGQTAEAAAERKKGAELERVAMNRQRATVSTNSGNSLLKKGQVTDAIERYQEALSDDPNYAEAHRGLGQCARTSRQDGGSRGGTAKGGRVGTVAAAIIGQRHLLCQRRHLQRSWDAIYHVHTGHDCNGEVPSLEFRPQREWSQPHGTKGRSVHPGRSS